MRRPSWNKSQAMQQVISLKTLLEGPSSDDKPVRERFQPASPSSPPLSFPILNSLTLVAFFQLSSASPSTPASAAATNDPPQPPPGDLESPSDASGGNASPRYVMFMPAGSHFRCTGSAFCAFVKLVLC